MSRTLLKKDNISIAWEINKSFWLGEKWRNYFHLHLVLLINGKLKSWDTNYELVQDSENPIKWIYKLEYYHAWTDLKDLLQTLWYDLEDINIDNWIEEFQID